MKAQRFVRRADAGGAHMSVRLFVRLAMADSPSEALDAAARHGAITPPRLHDCSGGAGVVGVIEVLPGGPKQHVTAPAVVPEAMAGCGGDLDEAADHVDRESLRIYRGAMALLAFAESLRGTS